MNKFQQLYTPLSQSQDTKTYYPRPTLIRNSFCLLDGEWEFAVTDGVVPKEYGEKIRVPFCPQSLLSGIGRNIKDSETLWYRRAFSLPREFIRDKVILHFGAVDQKAMVWLNGALLGTHTGGYASFSFDITHSLRERNVLVVQTEDKLDEKIFPYGKQKHKRGGMWYTPVSGIWQSVWLESVPEEYVTALTVTNTLETADITIEGVTEGSLLLQTPEGTRAYPFKDGKVHIDFDTPRHWTPEDPYLYYYTVRGEYDEVTSYFALRTIETRNGDDPALLLNGKPYFFHGVLDQGYWSDGLFTPASPAGYAEDILKMKALGFNMLRKHIKVEAEQFYYECDRLGMAVFQDMVNNSDYSFFRDTALPTLGLIKKKDSRCHKDPTRRAAFLKSMTETVAALSKHPSVCVWTIFNEGWGQFEGGKAYELLKSLDPTRPVDTASGWFACENSDFDSRHVYFRKIKLRARNKPLFLSEFGGFTYRVDGHVFNPNKSYGYGACKTRRDFALRICRLYEQEILPLTKQGLCAAVYTQLSDVEDEINGLVTYDRQVDKLTPEDFNEISKKIKKF